jgi:hypothetical protein
MKWRQIFVKTYFCLTVVIAHNCCAITTDTDNEPQDVVEISSNYNLTLDGQNYSHSDVDIDYDMCRDIDTRSIRTSKLYTSSKVVYEIIFSPLNIVNQPKIFSYAIYLSWDRWTVPDMSLEDAILDFAEGSSLRDFALQFVIRDSSNVGFTNISGGIESLMQTDQNASENITITNPDVECLIYGGKIGEIRYNYVGYIYNLTLRDSIYVDYLDLNLFIPLNL